MVQVGDDAPDFTAPLATGSIEQATLSERSEEAPIVLAFFPGAFTGVCTHEMNTFEERLAEFREHGATVYGVSIDTPFALEEFRDELELSFGLISDTNRDLVHRYDVATDFVSQGVDDVAKRSVFVIDDGLSVTYAWVTDDPSIEPEYDDVLDAVADVA